MNNVKISEWDMINQVATDFVKNSPTYTYDGVPGSIKIEIHTKVLNTNPLRHLVVLSFECKHAGYGDRTGKILAQVITSHIAEVMVIEGNVVRVIYDGTWDELNQRML